MNGKGDKRRPQRVDQKTFDSNWDRIFNKQQQQPAQPNLDEKKRQAQDRRNG